MNPKANDDEKKKVNICEKFNTSMDKKSIDNKTTNCYGNRAHNSCDCKPCNTLRDNDKAISIQIPPKSMYFNVNSKSHMKPHTNNKNQVNCFLEGLSIYEKCNCKAKIPKDFTPPSDLYSISMKTDIDCAITINTVSPDVLVKKGLTINNYIIFMSLFKKYPNILIKGIKRKNPLNYTFNEFMDCFKLFLYIFLKGLKPDKNFYEIYCKNNSQNFFIPPEIFSAIKTSYHFDIKRFLKLVGKQKVYNFDYDYNWIKEFDLSSLPQVLVDGIRKGIKGTKPFTVFCKYEPDKINLDPQCKKAANIIKDKLKFGIYWEMHPSFIKYNDEMSKLALSKTLPNLILDCFREKTINLMIEQNDLDKYPIMTKKLPEGTINYNEWNEDTFSCFRSLILKKFWKNK